MTNIRPARDVANRLLVLAAISEAARHPPPTKIRDWFARHGLNGAISDWERAYLAKDAPDQESRAAASWRLEACAVLSWALGRIAKLPPAVAQISLEGAGITDALAEDPKRFVAESSLRSSRELSEFQMDVETQHWGVRAGPTGRKSFPPANWRDDLDPLIIYQRHYAINWVMGQGENWDAVPTDT